MIYNLSDTALCSNNKHVTGNMGEEPDVKFRSNSRDCGVDLVNHENGGQKKSPTAEIKESNDASSSRGELPYLFERSSGKWWNPRMDSRILENQCSISNLPLIRNIFRHVLMYVCVSCIAWIIYFAVLQQASWLAGAIWGLVLALICVVLLVLTKRNSFYARFSIHTSVFLLLLLAATGLVAGNNLSIIMTPTGSFFIAIQFIFLLHILSPFPFPFMFAAAVVFSIIFEVLHHINYPQRGQSPTVPIVSSIFGRVLLHLAIHIVSSHLSFNLQCLRRCVFWKVSQLVQMACEMKSHKEFKSAMIKSLMPPSVANELMQQEGEDTSKDGQPASLFRPFTMERKTDVSILYADIVGFTQMSAGKQASELVGLLNDLFGRFDRLCEVTGCEKISTLGDCYYCVSGCPEKREDHAICCVEMGLGMVSAIKEFCQENNANVNMRVGIHTGTVLCGIVGTKRFKFDVWSNDVSLANGMEQHGIPGRVHISKETLSFLGDEYEVEESKLESRYKDFFQKTGETYLIVDRKNKSTPKNGNDVQAQNNGLTKVSRSSTNKVSAKVKGEKRFSKANEMKHSAAKPLLKKASTKRQKTNVQPEAAPENKQEEQLMQFIGEHVGPFQAPGPLSRSRDSQDQKLVDEIKDSQLLVDFYRSKSFNIATLWFNDAEKEQKYRGICENNATEDLPLASAISPRYRLFRDLLTSSVVTLLIFVSSILLLGGTFQVAAWVTTFAVCFVVLVTLSILMGVYLFSSTPVTGLFQSIAVTLSTWIGRHTLGGLLSIFPSFIVFSHLGCQTTSIPSCSNYEILFGIAIMHFMTYDQLSSFLRLPISAIVAAVAMAVILSNPCNSALICMNASFELILNLCLLLLFIWMIMRHFEYSYRLEYDSEIDKRNEDMLKTEKRKVNQLIQNFIPSHVYEEMKGQPLYSKTHEKVGVIFATIVNFNELYEESFEGGMEFIRYLSELISDVDDLLNLQEYKDIEKIKTIGTTFMIASGLNPHTDQDQETTGKNYHLCKLMDFCIAMQDAVDNFNKDMLNFQLVLRIGFNHGEVTAGVIGSTKQLYDIWGDTVNIASRMDSTGVQGRVQLSNDSKNALADHYNFEYIGEKLVKGKGKMQTYLLVRDDEGSRVIVPNPTDNYNPF
uniref:adenylate cyclase type 9-like isoform X1 n=1 Tax=Ciona intestinalis TaxID=7719 RepID=UPI00089DBFE9|nr:adenylate cyclase type 9-like isoform X1 [Ciona intestinalis]|eukprot:XP_002129241.2 adenylate cyclase type 9-like isoform X1 [Ciona intestinalis]